MKKFIIALVALFVAANAHAQIGVIAGMTSSKTNAESAYADAKSINQYHAGVVYKIELSDFFTLQPGVIYNVKGSTLGDMTTFSGISSMDCSTGFVEVPVQLQVGTIVDENMRIFAFAEPYAGYAVSNKVSYGDIVNETWDNIKNKLEYGVSLGVGIELIKHVQVQAKYFWDMGEVYGNESNVTLSNIYETLAGSTCSGVSASVVLLF